MKRKNSDSPKKSNTKNKKQKLVEVKESDSNITETLTKQLGIPRSDSMILVQGKDNEDPSIENVSEGIFKVGMVSPSYTKLQFSKIMRVLLIKKWKDQEATGAMIELASYLQKEYNVTIVVEADVKDSNIIQNCEYMDPGQPGKNIDLVIILGGDGTLLHFNSLLQEKYPIIPPILGFSLGSLGFLVPYVFEDYKAHIKTIMSRRLQDVILRTRILGQLFDANNKLITRYEVLNEILIDRGVSPYLTKLEFFVNDELTTYIQADGVIISTSTGSTAYSLSAGGPMLPPAVPAIVVTPICPHTLSFRPLVLPDSAKLKIRVPLDARATAYVSFDGRNLHEIPLGGKIVIQSSPFPVPTVCLCSPLVEWFRSITHRLNWNVRELQKGVDSETDEERIENLDEPEDQKQDKNEQLQNNEHNNELPHEKFEKKIQENIEQKIQEKIQEKQLDPQTEQKTERKAQEKFEVQQNFQKK